MTTFFIKEGYKCNINNKNSPKAYDDTTVNSDAYQIEVYKFAANIISSS